MCVWWPVKVIGVLEQPDVIEKTLMDLGLSAWPPQIAPARRVDLFGAA